MLTLTALLIVTAPQLPDPEPKAQRGAPSEPTQQQSRVFLPPQPHSSEVTNVVRSLRGRARFALSFADAPLSKVVPTIAKISGLKIIVSRRAGTSTVTWRSRGPTLAASLEQLAEAGNLYVVVEPNAVVRIVTDKEFRLQIRARGSLTVKPFPGYVPTLELRMLAYPDDRRLKVDLAAERKRLQAWLDKGNNRRSVLDNPMRIVSFNGLPGIAGGRLSHDIRWIPHRIEARRDGKRFALDYSSLGGALKDACLPVFDAKRKSAGPKSKGDFLLEFLAVDMKERGFTNEDLDLQKVRKSTDANGAPCLLYEMTKASAKAYSDLSAQCIGKCQAILLDGYMVSAPRFLTRIPGRGQIVGFSSAKLDAVVAGLRGPK